MIPGAPYSRWQRWLNLGLVLLGYVLGSISAGHPLAWDYQLGDRFDSQTHWSLTYGQGAWYAGAYAGCGPAQVSRSLDGLHWQADYATHPGPVESVSGFAWAGGQLYATSESDNQPALYLVPSGGGELQPMARAEDQYMYLFPGQGVVCVGSNRDVGGYLMDLAGNRLTPDLRASDGHPLFAWTALEWQGQWVAGTSRGLGEYHDADAGNVATWRPGADSWSPTPFSGGGVVQITTLSSDPGALYFCTTKGQIYRSTDLERFDLRFQAQAAADVRLYSLAGHQVEVSASGKIYQDGHLVLSLPGDVDFLRLEPGPDGVLGGVLNRPDGAYGVRITH